MPAVFIRLERAYAPVEFVVEPCILERDGSQVGNEVKKRHLIVTKAVGL